ADGGIALAIAGALVVGFLVGTVHAWLITAVGLPPFVATLASLVGLRSLAKIVNPVVTDAISTRSIKIEVPNQNFARLGGFGNFFGSESIGAWVIPFGIFLCVAAGLWFLMSRTVVGRHLYAMGGNEQAARLSG